MRARGLTSPAFVMGAVILHYQVLSDDSRLLLFIIKSSVYGNCVVGSAVEEGMLFSL